MQLPLELMTQMASAGSPLMAAPASGASDAEAMAEAGQFGDLLNQALVAQAGAQPQNAPAPGVSLLTLLQNTPEAPADAATNGEAPPQPGNGEAVGSLNWRALAANPAIPSGLPQNSPMVAPASSGMTAPQTTEALAPKNPAQTGTEPAPASPTTPQAAPITQDSDNQPPPTTDARTPRPAEPCPPANRMPEPDTKASLASQPAPIASATDESLPAEDTSQASDPAPHKQQAPADAATEAPPPPQAPAVSQPGPTALPVSVVELQVRAQMTVPSALEKQAPGQAVSIQSKPSQPEAVAPPLPATPSLPAAQPAQTLAVQPAFQQSLQGALHPDSQGKASPSTQPAANEALGMPAPANTDSLPLPPPPMMETPARGETPPKAELPLAVSIAPAQAAPVEEASQPTQSPHGLAQGPAVHETTELPRHAHASEPRPLHDPASLPADMPLEVSTLDLGPAPDASTASQASLPAVGASTPTADASGKAAPPATPLFHPRAEALGDQVVEGTAYSVKNGHKELTIRLNPDNLGEVRVNLVSRNVGGTTELSARLIASNPESHEVLQQQLHQLKDSLEAQGVRIERLSVVMATAADTRNETRGGGDFGQQFSQPQQQHTAQQGGQHAGQFGQETPGGFNLGQPGQGPAGQSPQSAPRTHYASAPNQAADLAEAIQRPEATLNENGRISVLA